SEGRLLSPFPPLFSSRKLCSKTLLWVMSAGVWGVPSFSFSSPVAAGGKESLKSAYDNKQGRRQVKVLPWPGALSTLTHPPCSSIIILTMASPKPCPPERPEVTWGAW